MSIWLAILLGIVQGLTEFLPVSSSAHLVIVPFLLQLSIDPTAAFVFDVLVQMGTLVAVIFYFWKDLWEIAGGWIGGLRQGKPFGTQAARMGWYLILATIPAGLLGVTIKDTIEALFSSATGAAAFLLVTAGLLLVAERVGRRTRTLEHMTWVDALVFGVAQAGAIFPGISRSGATMAGGLARHFDRPAAARFSFLMSIPVMLAAGLVAVLDLKDVPNLSTFVPVVAVGFVTAAVVGYFSIRWLLGYLMRHSLTAFAIYCAAAGVLTLAIGALR